MQAAVSRQRSTCGLQLSAARMQPHESLGRRFSFWSVTRWAVGARSREITVKGSNSSNLERDLSSVKAIREKCLLG